MKNCKHGDNRDLDWTLTLPDEDNKRSVREAVAYVIRTTAPRHSASILDIGVRDGYSIDCWCKSGYFGVLGTEILEPFVNHALGNGRNVIFDDITDTKIPGKFDIVYSRHSLEHVPHSMKAFVNMYDLVKPGGFLVIIVPMESKAKFNQPRKRKKHLSWFPSMRHFKERYLSVVDLKQIVFDRSENVGLKPQRDIVYIGQKVA